MNEEHTKFDPDLLALEELENINERIDRATTRAAEVMVDLQQHGALYQYVLARRSAAARALRQLAEADPTSSTEIMQLQATVRLYTDACSFIDQALAAGEQAEAIINEEFHDDE